MGRVIAVDIGAGSYRMIEGIFEEGNIYMRELSRYRHTPVYENGHYFWNVEQMRLNMIQTLWAAAEKGEPIRSVGFDSFGTDFGLLDKQGNLLSKPLAYRDSISDGMYEKYFAEGDRLYGTVGGIYTQTSTAHILKGMEEKGFLDLKNAEQILLMPDLFAYLFTGMAVNELTIATSSRLIDINRRKWDMELIQELGLPEKIFHPLREPGTGVGGLREDIKKELKNLTDTVVVTVSGHDTASALSVMPELEHCSFISSGSWSVKGVVSEKPYTSSLALAYGMSNEGLAGGRYRLLRNITGLWLLEECIRDWAVLGIMVNIQDLAKEAEEEPDFPTVIYTDADAFVKPGDMTGKIRQYCSVSGQQVPETPVQFFQIIVKGLACEYRKHNQELYEVTKDRIDNLYIVGGGRNNRYLSQYAANVTGCKVICGHPEASALGNILMQLWVHGEVARTEEFSQIASADLKEEIYFPKEGEDWNKLYESFLNIREMR